MTTPLLPTEPERETRARTRALASSLCLALAIGVGAVALEPLFFGDVPEHPGYGDPAEGRDAEVRDREGNDLAVEAPPEVSWPESDTVSLDLSGDGLAQSRVGGLPVMVSWTGSSGPDQVDVGVVSPQQTEQADIGGVLLAVAADDEGTVDVSVGYDGITAAYGGDWGQRLAAWSVPDCGVVEAECAQSATALASSNNGEDQTVTFTVATGANSTADEKKADRKSNESGGKAEVRPADYTGNGSTLAHQAEWSAAPASTRVVALAASEDSAAGDYKATSLAESSSWNHSGASGAFTWSYPFSAPSTVRSLAPELALSYSSQSSDGRTSATNNQGSWIGEGFTLEPGYIERRYQSCSDDGHKDEPGAGDQCWARDNATISLNGSAGDLVKDGDTWRLSSDDGSKVEHLTGADNGDNNGEYWKVTTTDGTQYYFGRHQLPGHSSGDATTDSTWTVPVFGDDSGEPCYNSTFADAYCDQAWRWNLDYIVSPTGAAMAYYYGTETNHYARHGDTDVNGDAYIRGGYLTRVDYGLDADNAYATAPSRIVFDTSERCLATKEFDCDPAKIDDGAETARNWADVPYDRNCKADTKCEYWQASPTFWTRKRLTGITTEVHDGSGYQKVDSWKLEHSWVSNGDGTRSLWLEKITRTGHTGTDPITLPSTELLPVQLENRVDETGDNISPMIRPRIATIYTDLGGQIDVTYNKANCTPGDTPTPETNTRRCFPVIWKPASKSDDITDWFNKYPVAKVTVSDRVAESPDQVTTYLYKNPAWRKADYKGIGDEENLTWSDWRGYRTVTTVGAPGTTLETQSTSTYFQGMHGDDDGSGGTKNVTFTNPIGQTVTDYKELSGQVAGTVSYNDGTAVQKSATTYWRHQTAEENHDWGSLQSYYVRENIAKTDALKKDGTWRRTSTNKNWDSTYGRLTEAQDLGGPGAADDQCTRYEYADNTGRNIVSLTKRVETVSVGCSATPDRATQVISDTRTLYDGGAYGDAPTKGLATETQILESHDGVAGEYKSVAKTSYDSYGRSISVTDAVGNTIETAYTDTEGHLVESVVTNPLGHREIVKFDIRRGSKLTKTDANGKTTTLEYDALGRMTTVWTPGQVINDTNIPYLEFEYNIASSTAPAVVTKQVTNDLNSQRSSVAIYDGLARQRQTQALGPDGGRLVSDTIYDALGRTSEKREAYYATGAPSTSLLVVDTGETDERAVTEFDDLGRATTSITYQGSEELWHTTTEHWADQTALTAVDGGTATRTYTDARGNTTELRQYYGAQPTGDYEAISYTYTPAGKMETATDAADNVWKSKYNQLGQKVKYTDPDTGTTTYTYDALGNQTSTTDARGVTVSTEYDALGRTTATWEGQPGTGTQLTKRLWDTKFKGYETSSISYQGDVTIYKYITGRNWNYKPTSTMYYVGGGKADPLKGYYSTSVDYNIDGTLEGQGWSAQGGLDAESVYYERNKLGQVVKATGSDGVYMSSAHYTPTGELTSARYPAAGTTVQKTNVYGTADRLTESWIEKDDLGGALSHVNFDYDDAGNIDSIIDEPTTQEGQRQAQCFAYDGLRRLTEAWTTAKSGTGANACDGGAATTGVSGAAPFWQSYTFDKAGNRTSMTHHAVTEGEQDRTVNYDYNTTDDSAAHALDAVEADKNMDGTIDPATETTQFAYDSVGNTKTVSNGNGFNQQFEWSPTGKLASLTTTGSATADPQTVGENISDSTTTYAYDADGKRIFRFDGDTTANLFLNDLELVHNTATGKTTSTRAVKLSGGVTRIESSGNQTQLQFTDHHGTGTIAIDCTTGDITRRQYDPYGNLAGNTTTSKNWIGQKGYVGGTIDGTGYTHIGAREYNSTLGRFMTVDPIADMGSALQLNGYAYSNNNPTTFSDPTGLLICSPSPGAFCPGQDISQQEEALGLGGSGEAPPPGHPAGPASEYPSSPGNNSGSGSNETEWDLANSYLNCNSTPVQGACATTDTNYVVEGGSGIVTFDMFIAADEAWGLHGDGRGHTSDPGAESRVRIYWDLESGRMSIVAWPSSTKNGDPKDALETCFCDSGDNRVVTDEMQGEKWTGSGHFRIEITARQSAFAIPSPEIDRRVDVWISDGRVHGDMEGDAFPSTTISYYEKGKNGNILGTYDETTPASLMTPFSVQDTGSWVKEW
ncbi:RHS repeat-associated core domain-containing protein [Salininema proteolyticum]|uniref:RHS repeat-associated core domain-containing protein n=1 Tax=Salininema proteolyticum TaxID=1607685 RepID=A0ABV8U3B0_9ACTN